MSWFGAGLSIAFAVIAALAARDTRHTLEEIRDEMRRRGD